MYTYVFGAKRKLEWNFIAPLMRLNGYYGIFV